MARGISGAINVQAERSNAMLRGAEVIREEPLCSLGSSPLIYRHFCLHLYFPTTNTSIHVLPELRMGYDDSLHLKGAHVKQEV
jgi:hypothetical protein